MVKIAEKLKLKRKEKGLSQQKLAEGICEQSQISKIERGNYMPAADLLYKLAVRLQVPIDYFFNDNFEVPSSLEHFKRLSSKLLEDRNYVDLAYLYTLEKEKANQLSEEDNAFLEWTSAILNFYLYDNKEQAIIQLEQLLTPLKIKQSVYLRILNTLSNFYSLMGRNNEYLENYELLISIYKNEDLSASDYLYGYIRVKYNHAHYLLGEEKKIEAVAEALETIEICKNWQTTYQLASLLILLGNAGEDIIGKEQMIEYYKDAKDLCRIFENKLMYIQIENYLNELTSS
jgi:putative transcriptional regulator plcR